MNVLRYLTAWLRVSRIVPVDWRLEYAYAKLSVLEQGIKDAFTFLKKYHLKSFFYRQKLPWYLVLGQKNAGKSSLLNMSELGLTSIGNQPLNYASATTYCDWCFGKEAIFLDTSGTLLMSENPKHDSHFIWGEFLNLLRHYRRRRPLDGLILCVDFHDFLTKNHRQRQLQIDILRHRIQLLAQYHHPLPIYLVFTKCDRIAGFTESFNALSPEDCRQTFGISLAPEIVQQNFPQKFQEHFDLFLKRLNEQLIGRLHREHNLEKRMRIKDFPLQIESQKREILNLAAQLHSTKISLCGVYFTSSLQDGKSNDALSSLLQNFGLSTLPVTKDYAPQIKAFFIHQTLHKIIHKKITTAKKIPVFLISHNKHFYSTVLTIFFLSCLLIIPSYIYNKRTLDNVQNLLHKYPLNQVKYANSKNIHTPLSNLNNLRQALEEAQSHTNPLTLLAFDHSSQATLNLKNAYEQALQIQFIPLITEILETQLQPTEKTKAQILFNALKAYLMLGDTTHLDKSFVMAWFKTYWQRQPSHSIQKQQQLLKHLDFWLTHQVSQFQANSNIIQSARTILSSLPLSELTYLTLQEKYQDLIQTNDLYTAARFDAIYFQEIPELSQRIAQGDDWVLNLKLPSNLVQPLVAQLIRDVQQLYIQRYTAFWQEELFSIPTKKFKNLSEARDFAASFNTKNSPLLALLDRVETNLKPTAAMPETKDLITIEQRIRELLITANQDPNLQKALTDFTAYLNTIIQAENSSEATLKATQARMKLPQKQDPVTRLLTLSKSAPSPMNEWLHSLALQSWQTMLKLSQNHLNLVWITAVKPEYNEYIKNRYPVFKNAQTDIELEKFSQFFGPNGTMESFFKLYLADFIDNNQLYWKWKFVDGERLNIDQTALEMLNRADLIRKMYFYEHQNSALVKFSLMPTDLSFLSQNIVMNLNGQRLHYSEEFRQAKNFVWPGNDQINHASLEMNPGSVKKVLYEEKGPWAVFKLLAKANTNSAGNTKIYNLNFNVSNASLPYQLEADKIINPFIPDILTSFRCPEKL